MRLLHSKTGFLKHLLCWPVPVQKRSRTKQTRRDGGVFASVNGREDCLRTVRLFVIRAAVVVIESFLLCIELHDLPCRDAERDRGTRRIGQVERNSAR